MPTHIGKIVFAVCALFFSCFVEAADRVPVETSGWLGADVAYSRLRLRNERIWLFGDTFLGDLQNGKRINGKIVNNSVGIDKNGAFSFFAGTSRKGFFVNHRELEWYWPADLVIAKNRLYLFLRRVKKVSENDPFGFKQVGNDLAMINNFHDTPDAWKVEIRPLGYDQLTFGVAAAVQGQYIFLLIDQGSENHDLHLARISLSEIRSQGPRIEFFDPREKNWSRRVTKNPILKNGASEASLVFVPSVSRWRILLSPKGLSQSIVSYEAEDVTGPWIGPKTLYTCSESDSNPNYYCYAAKEIDTKGESFLFTYNVNSRDFWDLSRDPSIYVPRILKLENQRR